MSSPSELQSKARNGIGFFGWLTILFIGLKLTDYIDWSWWLVLAPILWPFYVLGAILAIGLAAALLVGLVLGAIMLYEYIVRK